jgi:4'-phosphopantetheinyl transferase EntD
MNDPQARLFQLAEAMASPQLPWPSTHPHLFVRKRADQVAAAQECQAHLWPEAIRRSVPARRYEYVLGRLAAASLLADLGIASEDRWVRSESRQPIWPPGVVGAISHTDELVAVTVGPASERIRAVGIDIELLPGQWPVAGDLDLCFNAHEAGRLAAIGHGLLVGFSAKESLFKCLAAEVGRYFDFLEVEIVAVDLVAQQVEMRLMTDLSLRLPQGTVFSASYRFACGHVWTGITR